MSAKPTQSATGWVRRARTWTVIRRSAVSGGGARRDQDERQDDRQPDDHGEHNAHPSGDDASERHAVPALARLADLLTGHGSDDHRHDRADERDDREPADAGHQGDHSHRVAVSYTHLTLPTIYSV